MNGHNQSIVVIIVNYHSEELVCKSLESLKGLGRTDLRYVVVDNSECPNTATVMERHPDVVVLRPGANIGFAAGCNTGIRHALEAGADYILLMNPDTRTERDFIGPLVEELEKDSGLGMIGPKIVTDNADRKVWTAPGRINWWLGKLEHVSVKAYTETKGATPAEFLSGAVLLLRSEAVRNVGLMADQYFLYFEDTDYARAFLNAGWSVKYMPEVEVLHSPSSITGYQSEDYVYYFARNRIWFMRRWARWYHYLTFLCFCITVKLPGSIILFGFLRRRPRLVKAFFKGFVDGVGRME